MSRGLAAWNGKIYVAALDGRLIALDARTGKEIWTDADARSQASRCRSRGAARGGWPDRDRQRAGATSARAATCPPTTRRPASRRGSSTSCRAIPRSPDGVASDSIMPMAAKTWTGDWWKTGGGGNNWDTIVYDPKLEHGVFRHGQRLAASAGIPQPAAAGTICSSRVDRRGECEDRQVRVALPGSAGRGVGLRQHFAADARRSQDRRARPPGHHARAEERVLLRARSQDGRADLGEELRAEHLGDSHRPEDGQAARCCRTRTSSRSRT